MEIGSDVSTEFTKDWSGNTLPGQNVPDVLFYGNLSLLKKLS